MSTRYKSKPEHDALVRDEGARPLDRAEAIYCLGLDGRTEHEAAFEALTAHEHPDIRARALQALLGWGRATSLPQAMRMLLEDPEPDARVLMVLGLQEYVRQVPAALESVCRALVRTLRVDDECKLEAYQALTELLGVDTEGRLTPARFDPERDIDWDLLAPYAEPPAGLH